MNGRVIAERYTIGSLISQGGMGQVWKAYDERLGRPVAVKLLRPDRLHGDGAEELRRRFLREARVTARVDHAGLVTVHDLGSDGEDLYLVMQYLDGADLADHLAENDPYPWPWAVAVGAQLCAILAAVHAVPVVHRDLKPRNVVVRPDGTLTVLDLGIASVLGSDTTRLTRTGAAVGSPAYMAPEQALGGVVGPRTDLYALGVVLHELLSGSVPFTAPTDVGVLHRHLYDPPQPLRELRPEVPPRLEALVLRLLQKDQADRPSGAAEVHRELVGLLPQPGAVAGRPAAQFDPIRPFLRPCSPWPEGDEGPGGPGAAAAQAVPSLPPSGLDVAEAVDRVKRLLDEGRATQAVDVLGGLLPVVAAQQGEGSPVSRVLRKQYAQTLLGVGEYARALPELHRLAADRAHEAGPADPQALQYRYEAAQCLEQLGEYAEALGEYRAVLAYAENPYAGMDPRQGLEIRRREAQMRLALGDRAGARAALAALLTDAERAHGLGHPFTAEIRGTLSRL
ncbi:serine/threonine-protein kinase [Streptacidiphilus jiangxiensis]|uniref:non-specific serine/threonine protein kinase n=1 Tax=Streptacidiphilus jiangxiensis TaxID=235985 RepID=A0A1H7FFF1_STRJI|nr:serine/threonine-protein kinase [Streptacidiphilus jiangxiensis]SEK24806.1 Serine/threonine protein kinase [Streptacidiphilus jiangxiensis]